MTTSYSSNRMDCAQYVLNELKIHIQRTALPNGWFHQKNCLIENIANLIMTGELKIKVKSFIFRPDKLQSNDIVFMKYHGKFAHHLARYIGDDHIEHCMPLVGICKDKLRTKLFLFGVRLWH